MSRPQWWHGRFEVPGPTIDLPTQAPFMGAKIVSVLAYPEAPDRELQERTFARLSASTVLSRSVVDGWTKATESELSVPINERELSAGRRRFEMRLQKRLQAGLLALEPLIAIDQGTPPPRTWGGKWNRAEALRDAVAREGWGDLKNFEKRVWQPTAAVLHIAAAWSAMTLQARKAGKQVPDIWEIVGSAAAAEALADRALAFENLLQRCQLGFPTDLLIRLRPS